MTLDAWQYGDPERVAIRKEEEALRKAKACGDCVHVYGRRCELFAIAK